MRDNINNPVRTKSFADLHTMLHNTSRFVEAILAQDELDNRGVPPNVLRMKDITGHRPICWLQQVANSTMPLPFSFMALSHEADRWWEHPCGRSIGRMLDKQIGLAF